MPPSISVVVCAYTEERWRHLAAALESVAAQTHPALETILVVDHNPGLLEAARAAFPAVSVVANGEEQGLSGARNTGVAEAAGDVVAFLDDDAAAERSWLERLGAAFDAPEVIAAGGRAVPDWDEGKPDWFPEEFNWVVGCTYTGHRETCGPIRNVIGCNMAFRREVILAAGGFRTTLGRVGKRPAGGEETELSIRAAALEPGGIVWYDPAARVSHFVPAERATIGYFLQRCKAEGESKALITGMVGSGRALESERSYVRSALPRGVLDGIRTAVLRPGSGGAARAGAIVAGLLATTLGYLRGRTRLLFRRPDGEAYRPAAVLHLDLAAPLPEIVYPGDGEHSRAMVWFTRDGDPVGRVVVDVPAGGLRGSDVAGLVPGEAEQTAPPAAAGTDGPLVSVVIATRDRPESLGRCLDSLLAADYSRFEVVVVDNAPATEATRQLVASRYAADSRIRYLHEDRPGLALAHNRGLEHARGEVVAFTDDDVVVDPGWLRRLARPFADPEVGCVTGMIVPLALDTRAQWWLEGYAGFSKGFERMSFDLNGHRSDDPLFPYAAGRFGSGANMAFRASVLREIGGFDPALGAGSRAYGGDDLAAFLAVIAAGYRLVYEPAALVHHEHRRDEAGLSRQVFCYGAGLTAYLTSALLARPARALDLLGRIPAGLRYVLSPRSEKNRRQDDDFPVRLRIRELLGMLAGPAAYLRSRAAVRRILEEAGR